ncbi:Lrp/AsnC family leucine-responsive transcriptional regulator [Pontibacter ummariensis]|uniref:Lrp/AsnC family transcriptional regulator, leucine-responsive regulatory protein n=1 Tax=Pontibacter ummariensis TaxID=1610492 RepID=A0A239CRI4_9BACT|nr:Lrp/AsnC family transcriptional regulator [Pontibacter ummariensis]PRY14900.1 Lrp/AsnC family leucine-responsive transcriptional regulator [Pontibacter ummariensis]SNS22003.1 Lrp/AsnC family transcriptional regulator, leucine-responsive regulatory protein [Pontibacter ummariensis]
MDKLNWSILKLLQQNARLSYVEIGREVGLSAPAVAERISRMEERGLIERYRAELNLAEIGLPLMAFVTLKVHSGKLNAFLALVPYLSEVLECHRVTGNECLVMKCAMKSPLHLEELINKLMEYGEPTTSIILSSPVKNKVLHNDEV